MKKILIKCFFIFVIALFSSTSFAKDKAEHDFDSIKSKYLSLKNTDPELKQFDRWLRISIELSRFVNSRQDLVSLPNAFFLNSLVYENLYLISKDAKNLDASFDNLKQLIDTYPNDQLADDALLKRARMLRDLVSDLDAAKSVYQTIVNNYVNSDMYSVAKAELENLEKDNLSENNKIELIAETSKNADLTNQQQNDWPLVVIDPGHGGEDFGSTGVGGLLEKDVTLDIAYRLKKLLEAKPGVKVRLTRRVDKFVPLVERTNLANDFEAALFVSLHTNASPKSNLQGIETYYLDTSGDISSKRLAERENKSVEIEALSGDLQYMISDLIQNAKISDSIALANLIQKTIISDLKDKWKPLKDLGVKKALFYVLVGAHMPCVLVEMSFIDHPIEGERLSSAEFRQDLASSLARAIAEYLKK